MRVTHRSIEQHLVYNKPLNEKILLNSREEILKPLRVVRKSLEENQNENLASGELLDLMRRAKCFGINLARLDIRQESSRHSQLINEFLKKKKSWNYLGWSEDKKINLLISLMIKKSNTIKNFNFKLDAVMTSKKCISEWESFL